MQDETTTPVPIKDVPAPSEQPVAAPRQTPVAAPVEPPLAAAPQAATEEVVPVKEQALSKPKNSTTSPVAPVLIAILLFVVLSVCAYFVFMGK